MINGFTIHDTASPPAALTEILEGVQECWGLFRTCTVCSPKVELALPSIDEDHNVDKIRAIQVNSSAHKPLRLARKLGGPSTNSKQDDLSPCPA